VTAAGLVVHDAEDADVPVREGEAIAAAWPGAELVRTHGLGHRGVLRDPGVIQRVVSFVASG
jgi:pimeloyl-ACP methyl ester carboxylesterase